MASRSTAVQVLSYPCLTSLLCRGASSTLQWLSPAQRLCPFSARHCSTSPGQVHGTPDQGTIPQTEEDTTGGGSRKEHCVIVKGGPRTMIREDILDLFARHSIQIPPESITPLYNRRIGDGFMQHGWAVQCTSHTQVAKALRISRDKVGPHKVTVDEFSLLQPSVNDLKQALQSAGRYLLVQNLPPQVTHRDVVQMFRGFKLSEGESSGPVVMVNEPHNRERGQRGGRYSRDERPPRGDRRGRGGDGTLPRAAIVKLTNPEDAHAAWRQRHGRRYSFARGGDGPAPRLTCKILE